MSKDTSQSAATDKSITSEEQAQIDAQGAVSSPQSEQADLQKRKDQLKQTQAAKQKKAARRNAERNLRNIQQCLLCENIDTISNYHRQNSDKFAYQVIRQMYGSSERIVNELKSLPPLDGFFCVRTSILSLLQPDIRIFKVTHEVAAPTPDGVAREPKTNPTRPTYREIIFSSVFGTENATSTQQYLNSEASEPNWRNVGLQSFTFNQFGKSHGAMEQNIQCQLRLYVKSLKDLVAISPGSQARYVDLMLWPEAKINRDTQQYNPKHYEIKVVMGYKRPPKQALEGLKPTREEREFLKNIHLFNHVVSLTLYKYDFSIKETGEVDVTIDYFGRVDSVFNSSAASPLKGGIVVAKNGGKLELKPEMKGSQDFMTFSKIKSQLGNLVVSKQNPDLATGDLIDQVAELLKNPLFRHMYKDAYDIIITKEFEPADVQTALDNLTSKEGASLMAAVLRRQSMSIKGEAFQLFMKQLLDGNTISKDVGDRMFAISVNKENMDTALGIINAPTKGADKAKKEEIKTNTSNAIGLAAKSVRVGKVKDLSSVLNSLQKTEEQAGDLASNVESESSSKDAASIDTIKGAAAQSIVTSKSTGDSYEFYFIYLGDIIELAAKNAGMFAFLKEEKPPFNPDSYMTQEVDKDYTLTNMRLLLGPLEYQDASGKIRSINLAEFPISYDLFRNWFLTKIVREDNSKISLGSFLNKLINQLVLPSLGADCLRPIKLRNTRFQNIYVTIPGTPVGSAEQLQGAFDTAELLPMERKIDVSSGRFAAAFSKPARQKREAGVEAIVKNSYDYKLIQVNSIKSIVSRKADCKEDLKDGIYHFNIGSDRGILKEMIFSKTDLPGLAELRSAQAIEAGGDQLKQLAFPFNCNLKLVGNTLFIPGMIFYANPSFLGLGNPQDKNSIAYQLNLGGYFLVLTTKTTISPGLFETEVEGVTIGHGKVT